MVAESEDRSSSLSMKPQSLARHENQMLKSMWSKETIRTGYLLPELFVIVVNASGDPLTELLDPGGKSNYKIKILRRVTQIKDHAERMARGGVGSIPPKVLTSLVSIQHSLCILALCFAGKHRAGPSIDAHLFNTSSVSIAGLTKQGGIHDRVRQRA